MHYWSFPLAALLLLASHPAWALPSLAPKIRDKQVRVGLMANGYLTKTRETISDERTGNVGLNLGVRGIGQRNELHFGIEGDSLYGLRKANYRYIDIAEAYIGYDRQDLFAYFGRKRFDWSALDSYWSLGIFQPRFRWDYLNERENGIFGFFVGSRSSVLQTTAFWSPIFIPEQGAPFDIDGGSCKTASPWFSCPSSTMFLFNQPTDVRFSLDIPPVRSLIRHWSAGATARLGRETGAFGRLSYAHKPINQFFLSYEGRLNIATLQIPAVIRPRVLYHDVASLDLGWNEPRQSLVASAIWEKPTRDVTPSTWNTQEPYRAWLTGFTYQVMPLGGEFRQTRLELAYFRRQGGNGADAGPFVSSDNPIFEPRYAFRNAYSIAVATPIFDRWANNFLFTNKFVLDTANQGNILQSDLYFRPVSSSYLNLGLDLLGSESRSPVDFISRYQRNDRVRGAVAYVF